MTGFPGYSMLLRIKYYKYVRKKNQYQLNVNFAEYSEIQHIYLLTVKLFHNFIENIKISYFQFFTYLI